jgi:hypothetical protein
MALKKYTSSQLSKVKPSNYLQSDKVGTLSIWLKNCEVPCILIIVWGTWPIRLVFNGSSESLVGYLSSYWSCGIDWLTLIGWMDRTKVASYWLRGESRDTNFDLLDWLQDLLVITTSWWTRETRSLLVKVPVWTRNALCENCTAAFDGIFSIETVK